VHAPCGSFYPCFQKIAAAETRRSHVSSSCLSINCSSVPGTPVVVVVVVVFLRSRPATTGPSRSLWNQPIRRDGQGSLGYVDSITYRLFLTLLSLFSPCSPPSPRQDETERESGTDRCGSVSRFRRVFTYHVWRRVTRLAIARSMCPKPCFSANRKLAEPNDPRSIWTWYGTVDEADLPPPFQVAWARLGRRAPAGRPSRTCHDYGRRWYPSSRAPGR